MERNKWAHLVDKIRDEIQNSYFVFWVAENGDLRVSRDYVNNSWSVVTEEMPEYHAIEEVAGPLEAGCWLNGYGYVGRGIMECDLRYVGKVPKPSKKKGKIVGQTGMNYIIAKSKRPPRMAPAPDGFEKLMLAGSYDRIEVQEDGSIDVWNKRIDGREGEKRSYPEDSPLKGVIEKHVGPLKPGAVIDFEKLGEYKFKIRRRVSE